MARFTHLLFDFFGTLVDYSDSWVEQGYARSHQLLVDAGVQCGYAELLERWQQLLARFEQRALESLEEYSLSEVCEAFLGSLLAGAPPLRLVAAFRDIYLDEWNVGVHYIPGVPALLERLSRRHRLALVSNTHHAPTVLAHLDAMGIRHHFTAIVTSIEHGRRKPSPCIIERALRLSGGNARSALLIGDSHAADYLAAQRAGVPCVLVASAKAQGAPEHCRLGSILELERYLEAQGGRTGPGTT